MTRWFLFATASLLLPLAAGAAPQDPDVRIDPRADAQLRRMSDYLSCLQGFRVHTRASDERVSSEGQKIQFLIEQEVALKRPNHLRVERRDPVIDATVRYDGRQISVFGKRSNYYAIAPASPDLEKTIDTARDRYGIEAPAADLLVPHPYQSLMEDVVTGRYLGMESIDGVQVHHLAFQGRDVDWQIWIQDGAQPVPRRYSITTKKVEGQPAFTVELSKWQPNAVIADSEFIFQPPAGATRIALLPQEGRKP